MNKRQRILTGMGKTGGTEAPPARRRQIKEGLSGNGATGIRNLPYLKPQRPGGREGSLSVVPGGGRPMPTGKPGPQGSKLTASPGPFKVGEGIRPAGRPSGPRAGLGGNFQPGLGKQLSGRVASGAIDQAQAQKVAQQRQLLQKAFGSDWRAKVFGKGGARGASGPFAQGQVNARRAQGLERAKRKLS